MKHGWSLENKGDDLHDLLLSFSLRVAFPIELEIKMQAATQGI